MFQVNIRIVEEMEGCQRAGGRQAAYATIDIFALIFLFSITCDSICVDHVVRRVCRYDMIWNYYLNNLSEGWWFFLRHSSSAQGTAKMINISYGSLDHILQFLKILNFFTLFSYYFWLFFFWGFFSSGNNFYVSSGNAQGKCNFNLQ